MQARTDASPVPTSTPSPNSTPFLKPRPANPGVTHVRVLDCAVAVGLSVFWLSDSGVDPREAVAESASPRDRGTGGHGDRRGTRRRTADRIATRQPAVGRLPAREARDPARVRWFDGRHGRAGPTVRESRRAGPSVRKTAGQAGRAE